MAKTSLLRKKKDKEVGLRNGPFASFRREMDQMLERFFNGHELSPIWNGESLAPAVDVTESNGKVVVTAEVPGVEEKDLDVSLMNNVLTIRGEKKSEREEKGKDRYYSERSYGSFERAIPLRCEVQADKVNAAYKKGVLTVTLPKSAKAAQKKAEKIKIASA